MNYLKEKLDTLSDAIIAIIMTIMVLEIEIPKDTSQNKIYAIMDNIRRSCSSWNTISHSIIYENAHELSIQTTILDYV